VVRDDNQKPDRVEAASVGGLFHCGTAAHMSSNSGALVPATEGSTKPVTMTITNAGIATVEQYDLRMP
jgi:hypothetical protein